MQSKPAVNELELQQHFRNRHRARRLRRALSVGVSLLVAVWLVPYAWVFYWCSTATWQEPDPIPFANAVRQLSSTGAEIVPVATSGRVWMQVNRRQFANEDAITRLLARQGWVLSDVEGAGRFYKKDGKTLWITERMFTGRFMTFRAVLKP